MKAQLGGFIKARSRMQERGKRVCRAQVALETADLINVSNDDDKVELVSRALPSHKIVVIPYGVSRARQPLFAQVSSDPPGKPVVAFVGTFDYRKGAQEFPRIVRAVLSAIPEAQFRFLGSKGLFKTEAEIRSCFPKSVQKHLDFILTYVPDELPHHLSSCSVGVFPSYMEGFPFGVLEMMASSLPVIAYNAPGPPMMLPPRCLVERGDWQGLSRKVVSLLSDQKKLTEERVWAKQQAQNFSWKSAAETTASIYIREIKARHLV